LNFSRQRDRHLVEKGLVAAGAAAKTRIALTGDAEDER
jgi:hypothetical protein